jgi:hypothetical protein
LQSLPSIRSEPPSRLAGDACMGFVKAHDAPPIFGAAYAVYTKAL